MIYQVLFPSFPREYGRYRQLVYTSEEMLKLAKRDNGITDVYVGVYDKNLNIDKVVWDIDSGFASQLPKALEEAKNLFFVLTNQGIPSIVNFSGKKGFHVYALFEPEKMDYYTGSEIIKNIQMQFLTEAKLELADNHLIGNISALIRLPNTINNSRFCVPLPDDFVNWHISDVLKFSLKKHNLDKQISYRPLIKDFYKAELFYSNPNPIEKPVALDMLGRLPENINAFLKDLIRPCIYKLVTNLPNPPHFARVDLVTELHALGYKPEEIAQIVQNLKWIDYNKDTTMKNVEKYINYIPFSCKRLRAMGVKCNDGCFWNYWWSK